MDALVYFMRKHKIERRSFKEASAVSFAKKALSFSMKKNLTEEEDRLKVAGVMLYWAEGYKRGKGGGLDFANSDANMIKVFLNFLRIIFKVDEKRLRVYLYCYANQEVTALISFWSSTTNIPKEQFSKPYIREDFCENGRKMTNGLIHVRYSDKKLWLEIMRMIDEHKISLCVGDGVVNRTAL